HESSGTQARCSPPQITTTSSTSVRSTTIATQTTSLLPEHCTTRPASTRFSTSGCAITCSTLYTNCIADMGLIIPCGCTSVAVRPVTTYVCPSNKACFQCQTGWGLHKETETGC
ncbi:hypothetical protein QBC37DRAFT_254003, partial [Rhypophila decipiens]